uniref:Uncharacterized protein n=1 Tax=Setaria italica TaxID=4555 RepID=K3XP97_SETIT
MHLQVVWWSTVHTQGLSSFTQSTVLSQVMSPNKHWILKRKPSKKSLLCSF